MLSPHLSTTCTGTYEEGFYPAGMVGRIGFQSCATGQWNPMTLFASVVSLHRCTYDVAGSLRKASLHKCDRINTGLTLEPDPDPLSLMFTVTRCQLLHFYLAARKPKHTESLLCVNPVWFIAAHGGYSGTWSVWHVE